MMSRYRTYLFERYRTLFFFLGLTWFFTGMVLFVPITMCVIDQEPVSSVLSFALPGLITVLAGWLLMRHVQMYERVNLSLQEGALVVTLSWGSAFVIGALPFVFGMDVPFHLAVFESASGWTTTGASIVDPDSTARSFLLFRSLTEFVGGAGLVILTLSAAAGPMGASLSAAEGRSDHLVPNVRRSAKLVLTIYLIYWSVASSGLMIAGMSFFDAINHAMVAVSTGGFSTRTASIAAWDNPWIEAVLIMAMFAGATNFATAYSLITGRSKEFYKNGELRVFIVVLAVAIALVTVFNASGLYPGAITAARHATFGLVSAISGTGLSTADYASWGGMSCLIFIVMMIIGGGTGSTAGGIKQFRVYAIYRAIVWEFTKMFRPPGTLSQPEIWQGIQRKFLSSDALAQIALFVMLYFGVLLICTICFLAYGYGFSESLFEISSALGNVGLTTGITKPDMPQPLIWVQIIAMFLGRLEIFTVLVGFVKLVKDGAVLCSVSRTDRALRRKVR
jgi:trk system potassium uptake protein TrkH